MNSRSAAWLFILGGVLTSASCTSQGEGYRVGAGCFLKNASGGSEHLPFGQKIQYEKKASLPFMGGKKTITWLVGERRKGELPAHCVSEKIPDGLPFFPSLMGAVLFAEPEDGARQVGRLTRKANLKVAALTDNEAWGLALVDNTPRGFVQISSLLKEESSPPQLADALQAQWEKAGVEGFRLLLAQLDPKEVASPQLEKALGARIDDVVAEGHRELAANLLVALGKHQAITPAWKTRACALISSGLAHADLFNAMGKGCAYPRLFGKKPLALDDPHGKMLQPNCQRIAGQRPQTDLFSDTRFPVQLLGEVVNTAGRAWACAVSTERAQLFVADRHGARGHLGTAFVQLKPSGGYRQYVGLLPVGLGACAIIESDPGSSSKSGTYELNLACFPPPRTRTKAADRPPGKSPLRFPIRTLLTGMEKKFTEAMSQADCDEVQKGGGLSTDCFVTRSKLLGVAQSAVVMQAGAPVLCVKDLFVDEISKKRANAAYRFIPGEIQSLATWPVACNVDTYKSLPLQKHHE